MSWKRFLLVFAIIVFWGGIGLVNGIFIVLVSVHHGMDKVVANLLGVLITGFFLLFGMMQADDTKHQFPFP